MKSTFLRRFTAITIMLGALGSVSPIHANEASTSSNQTGSIQVRTYLDTIGNPLGGAVVHVANTGFATGDHDCNPYKMTTIITEGLNYGHAMFPNCPVANDGGPKKYHLSYVSRQGYHLSNNTPHPIGSNFTVRANQTTVVSVILSKNHSVAPPPATTQPAAVRPPTPTPAPQPTPTVVITPVAVATPAPPAPAPAPAALPQTGSAAAGFVGITGIVLAVWYYRRSRRSLHERQLSS